VDSLAAPLHRAARISLHYCWAVKNCGSPCLCTTGWFFCMS
jgi:hypothetical protein